MNHEGIILSHKEDVVYSNDQIPKVFETLSETMEPSDKSKALIEILNNLEPEDESELEDTDQKEMKTMKKDLTNSIGLKVGNMWSQI